MRVLFFNYEYPPLGGGAANATFYILQEFSKIPDLTVDLVTSSIDNEYHLETLGNNIEIHRLPIGKNKNNLHFQSQKDLLIYYWKAYRFAKKLIRKNQYDLCHSFFTVPCGFLSYQIKKKYKLPYIISLRGADVPGYSERFTFLYKIITPLVKSIWENASKVISNSEGLKKLALKTNSSQSIGIIFNGVDINCFKPNVDKGNNKFYITAGASRITARKGINYLIEAIGILASKHQNIYMDIIGDGNEKYNLISLVEKLRLEDRIEFLGRIPRDETAAYYQQASLFVLPSLNEGMSNAMLEALASGLPIISTDTGGAKELVKDGENGLIVK
ncbi:glycosyltransferase family 4 protein, partial [Patescibacteria group bacterium]